MVICVLIAAALLCWPGSIGLQLAVGASGQPASEAGTDLTQQQEAGRRPVMMIASMGISVVAVISGWAGGPLVAASATMSLSTVAILLRSEMRRRHRHRDLTDMLAASRTLGREIRAGAAPIAAIRTCVKEQQGRSGRMLADLAVEIAGDRGGSPDSIATRAAGAGRTGPVDPVAEITGRLARGWLLSARHGVPMAVLIDTVSDDLDDRLSAVSQRDAQVSGPRVSGYVLAAMPVLGVLLGTGMGADPLHVLFATGAGRWMLLTGTILTCAGLAWTARIVRG